MRTRWKILSSVIAAVMVLSSLSAAVFADETVIMGFKDSFEYLYNSETGVLNVKCNDTRVKLYELDDLPAETVIDKIVLDVSDVEPAKDEPYLSVSAVTTKSINADSLFTSVPELELISDEEKSFEYIDIMDFRSVTTDGFVISDKISTNDLYLNNIGVDSLDFLDGVNVKSVIFDRCGNLEVADMSDYPDLIFHFSVCENLAGVTLPETLTTIEYGEFFCSSSLKCIELPSSLETIMPMAFYGCGLETIKIPDGVDEIKDWTFNACSHLESITLPVSVKSVDITACYGCSSLKDVYYTGTEEDWNKITISNYRNDEALGYETLEEVFQGAAIHFDTQVPTGWVLIDGSWHLYDSDGKMLTGWQQDGGKWYFLAENGDMRIGWQNSGNKWYYLDPDTGAMKTGWLKDGGKWYFLKSNGEMATGWTFTDTQYNFFDESGAMKTGWLVYDGSWYYWDSNGLVVEGWLKDGGKWYYLYPELAYEWQTIDGVKYFFDSSTGAMVTGWKKIDGEWYYFESSGAMKTGWLNDNGTWYFLKNDGTMAAGEYCKGYWINEDATWTYPYKFQWKQDSKGWYYIASNGWYVKNETVTIDGVEYEFDSAGYINE